MAAGFPSRRPLLFQAQEIRSASPCHPPPMRVPSRQGFGAHHKGETSCPTLGSRDSLPTSPSPRFLAPWSPSLHSSPFYIGSLINAQNHIINARFDALEDRFGAIDDRFEAIETRFGAIERSISDLKESTEIRFEAVDARFVSIERSISDLKENMDVRFQSLERLIIGLDRSVETRITGLESNLDARV